MRIYLSSSFSARESGVDDVRPLRRALRERGARLGIDAVLAENDPSIAAAAIEGDHMRILEGCTRLAGRCDAFFGMAFERHGTGIELAREPEVIRAKVSFFEAELLEACMTAKPVCIVRVREMAPSAAMQEFFHLVGRALGDSIIEVDRADILTAFEAYCRALRSGWTAPTPWLFDPVSIGRLARAIGRESADPLLRFLGGVFRDGARGDFNGRAVHAALQRAEAGVDDDGAMLGHIAKLSYLWIAVRELAKAPVFARAGDLNEALQRTLGLWNASAAWYGLHGAHPMGCLAALNELAFTRTLSDRGDAPHEARASAYYSIGARMRAKPVAKRFFKQALSLSSLALESDRSDPSGGFGLRASALARLAQLGESWRYSEALNGYRQALDWRTRHDAGDSLVGESLSEYAYALYRLPGRRREALRLMDEGVVLMRREPASARRNFLFRAERKRADLLKRARRYAEARAVAAQARDEAIAAEAFDQSRQLQELLDSLPSGSVGR